MEMMALELISLERVKQIGNGFDAEHDDKHTDKSILHAAGWIINDLINASTHESDAEKDDPDAPWPEKLATHVREKYESNLIQRHVIAAALLVAEIERLQRLEERTA